MRISSSFSISSNASIVGISATSGNQITLTANGEGGQKATITVSTTDGSLLSKQCEVTIVDKVVVTSLVFEDLPTIPFASTFAIFAALRGGEFIRTDAAYQKLPVKVMIMNNGYLGMVRQWQEKLYDGHYSQTKISSPDYVKLAEAYGAKGIRVEKEEEIVPALKETFEYDGPVFIDFVIEPLEMVYPWVLSGKALDNVLLSDKG